MKNKLLFSLLFALVVVNMVSMLSLSTMKYAVTYAPTTAMLNGIEIVSVAPFMVLAGVHILLFVVMMVSLMAKTPQGILEENMELQKEIAQLEVDNEFLRERLESKAPVTDASLNAQL